MKRFFLSRFSTHRQANINLARMFRFKENSGVTNSSRLFHKYRSASVGREKCEKLIALLIYSRKKMWKLNRWR